MAKQTYEEVCAERDKYQLQLAMVLAAAEGWVNKPGYPAYHMPDGHPLMNEALRKTIDLRSKWEALKVKTIADKGRGLYKKYIVIRTDGRSAPGEKHDGCRYFVLDVDHDAHAVAALKAYANSVKDEYPLLARDLLRWV